ncbi:sigma-54-dependent transcriptional regulator [Thiopseudomonas acetoxidans]|uniref:Sigma-54 dependent transcriptional regulator n=1 Tax=Thiopseudomonas acetoxidans TaxID=3041622 RepID=A0ABT7SQA7_9GAMM|nr:sigma-54 dependent transcriptional regulator [Thiopseudomonas sp. CY1220]MDM7858373.1 sigma-54 dependent transcriptional regulator [Thiopseudomonas sp. CY1220]
MSIATVLIVDDEPDILELLEITLSRMGLKTHSTCNYQETLAVLQQQTFDLCLTDMRLPDGSGLDIIEYVQQHHSTMPIAMITAYGCIETATKALKAGAFDYITKPVDINRLRELVSSALKLSTNHVKHDVPVENALLGNSTLMQRLRMQIAKLARSQAPVYISGESGTGKELVARQIHQLGSRNEQPFIPVNCGAIPSELMESEFFGHKKGSFSGATDNKIGLFQAAHGGTLFLDEVADLPLNMQVKLLRALQEKTIRPVGCQQEQAVDVRVLSATHKDLNKEVAAGRFRQDLFYRLNVIELNVPALRERPEDIALLSQVFLQRLNQDNNHVELTPEALAKLQSFHFPGNVRELENLLERAYTLCEGNVIDSHDLNLTNVGITPAAIASEQPSPSTGPINNLEHHLETIERKIIVQALEETRWNRTAAAERLGLSLRSLRYRLKKLSID